MDTTLPNFDKLWDYGDPAGTEKKFRDILPDAEVSQDAEYRAQLLTQIARCQGLQGYFDTSHATLDEVEKMFSSNDLKLARVRYALERGRAFNSAGSIDKAMPLFHSAYELATEQHELNYAIDSIHMIAIAERDPNAQVEWNLKGIALAEKDPSVTGWLHALLNNIGESYLLLKDYDSAYQAFHRLAEMQQERRGEADKFTIKDEAKALRLGGKPEDSVKLLQPVYEKLAAKGEYEGSISQELAEALNATGRTAEARPHFAKAYELLSKDDWAMQNEAEKVARMKEMSTN